MNTTSLIQSLQGRKQVTFAILLIWAALACGPALTPTAVSGQELVQERQNNPHSNARRSLFGGRTPQSPTAFTYQGQLNEGGLPATGAYDFQFTLYTTQTGGTELGSTVSKNLVLTNGVFKVRLDFGSEGLDHQERWLEIAVRPGGSAEPYTVLSPRQHLTPTPYATFAQQGQWSVIGVPVGVADRVILREGEASKSPIEDESQRNNETTPGIENQDAVAAAGTANFVAKFDTSGNPTANSIMFDNGSRVGIGTTSPEAKLHALSGGFTPQLQLTQTVTGDPQGQSFARLRFNVGTSNFWDIAVGEAANNVMNFFRQGTGNVMTLRSNGTVGIGTTTPSAETTLHIRAAQDNFGVLVDSLGQASSRIGLHAGSAGFSSLAKNAFFSGGNWFFFDPTAGAYLQEVEPSGNVAFRVREKVGPVAGPITWTNAMIIAPNGQVGIGGAPTVIHYLTGSFRPLFTVHGAIRVEDVPVWDGPNEHDLTWGAGAHSGVEFNPDRLLISREGSSRRYKEDIRPLDEGFAKILAVEPKVYRMREGTGPPGFENFGYLAEDLDEAGLKSLVIYDREGRPDGVKYKKVALYVNEVVKAQQKMIEQLQAEVTALNKRVRELSDRE
jgi:hypothetical protein